MIDDEWVTERWIRDLARYTPLSERQARVVVGVRAGNKSFGEIAEDLEVSRTVVRMEFETACMVANADRTTRLLFVVPRHELENLEEYPGAQQEVGKYVRAK